MTGEIVGAAFNILDKLLDANNFLRTQVGTCSADIGAGCANFTVAPKVSAYWEKGYNPNSYFGADESGLSFYIPGYSRLFILGGINGDTDTEDTDHFDNSIILHEYGHFLEDIYTVTDSPGGAHSGTAQIDPRLAWGEGWGNFIQAAVLNDPAYNDTYGNEDGSTGFLFQVDLETPDPICGGFPSTPGCDIPTSAGAGEFREFAITRFLWDIHDANDDLGGDDAVSGDFNQVWAAMVFTTGFNNSNAAFRSIGFVHDIQVNQIGIDLANWNTLRANTNIYQAQDRTPYALYVDNAGACGIGVSPYNISPTSTFSNLNVNNDFYHYYHPGGTLDITLNSLTTAGVEADADLYIYNESANLSSSASHCWAKQ